MINGLKIKKDNAIRMSINMMNMNFWGLRLVKGIDICKFLFYLKLAYRPMKLLKGVKGNTQKSFFL